MKSQQRIFLKDVYIIQSFLLYLKFLFPLCGFAVSNRQTEKRKGRQGEESEREKKKENRLFGSV